MNAAAYARNRKDTCDAFSVLEFALKRVQPMVRTGYTRESREELDIGQEWRQQLQIREVFRAKHPRQSEYHPDLGNTETYQRLNFV